MADKKSDLFVSRAGRIPTKIADAFNRGNAKLKQLQVPDSVHTGDLFRATDWRDWGKKFFVLNGENILQGIKWSGVTALWLMEHITRGFGFVAIDNFALRGMEKGYSNIKVPEIKNNSTGEKVLNKTATFIKNNPAKMSYLSYYMLMGGMLFGGYYGVRGATQDFDGNWTENVKEWVQDVLSKDVKLENFALDPRLSEADWQKQIDAIQPYVIAHTFLTEGYIANAYLDNGNEGTLTIGAGFTIADKKHRNFVKRVLGRPLRNGDTITVAEARLLADMWYREEIYPKMKKYFTAPIDARTFISLAITAYNAGENTYSKATNSGGPVRDAVNQGKSKEEIANLIVRQFGKRRGTNWGGMPNKYAVHAMYILGDISDDAVLNSISEAPYAIESEIKKDSQYVAAFDDKTMVEGRMVVYEGKSKKSKPTKLVRLDSIETILQKPRHRVTRGTKQRPIFQYLTVMEVDRIKRGVIFDSGVLDYQAVAEKAVPQEQKFVSKSDELNAQGEDLFFDKQYKKAIAKFEAALQENPRNFIVYSNLSIAHYRAGQYKQGLDVVQGLIQSEYFAQVPNEIKGYTYYNAALCREKMGDKAVGRAEKLDHYTKAKQNLDLAKKYSAQEYRTATNRLNKSIARVKSKKLALDMGTQKMRSAKDALLVYGREYSGNSMA